MFERLLSWWRVRHHHHLSTRPPLPHVLAHVQYPPLYHVTPVSEGALQKRAEQVAEARAIAALPLAAAEAIKTLLKQRGTYHLTLPHLSLEHPELGRQEVYVRFDDRKHTIELGVYAPSPEVRRLLAAARDERQAIDRDLAQRPIDVTEHLLLPAEVDHGR